MSGTRVFERKTMRHSFYAVGVALLGLAGFHATMTGGRPLLSQAEPMSQERSGPLDSRTIPHPDWVQVSGQIAETVTMKPDGQPDQLMARLDPVEGGRVVVDLGPADNLSAVRLEPKNHIHVRGPVLKNGNTRTIIAGEVIADGKVISIERALGSVPQPQAAEGETGHMLLSPAAPAPAPQSAQ